MSKEQPNSDATPEPEWKRRRRLEQIFGDVLPDRTRDEADSEESPDSDAWLKAQVPPHHGD